MGLEVRGITKKFGEKNVVDNVSLKIEEGKITSFIGPNGGIRTFGNKRSRENHDYPQYFGDYAAG